MFRHNLLVIFRSFKRYKSSFLINLVGLSTGMAGTLLIYLWVRDELNVDKFFSHDSQLFQVMEHVEQGDVIRTRSTTSDPIAQALAEEMPEVEHVAVTGQISREVILSIGDNYVRADGQFASKDYFNVFSYDLVAGNPESVLADKNAIIISEELALKLFDTVDDVVGKPVEYQHDKQYFVSGVFKNIPPNASEQFDFILSYELYKERFPDVLKWENTGNYVYAILKPDTDIRQFNGKISNYIKQKTNGKITFRTPFMKRYSEKYLHGNYENGVEAGGRIDYVILFSIIAIFILIIACINFMNLSTAKASGKTKEVGIKKTIGTSRRSLIIQYLAESMLMSFLSLVIAIVFVWMFIPSFNLITGKYLTLNFDFSLVISILAVTLFTGLASGSYPALYLSSFAPAKVLKGGFNTSIGALWTRKGLVIFQFIVSIVLIVLVLVVYKQIEFIQTKGLGYEKENIIVFNREGRLWGESQQAFLNEIRSIPGVVNASSIRHTMTGQVWGAGGINWEGKDPQDKLEFEIMAVNYGMIEMLGIEMKQGRPFSEKFATDAQTVIFNEAAIRHMQLKDPVGTTIDVWGRNTQIIGVAKDFHFESFHENIKPLCFRLWPEITTKFMVKVEAGNQTETINTIKEYYDKFNPGFTFDYTFLDEDYQAQYVAEQRVSSLSRYFSGLAIIISCLGLFGLATFTAERRLKEVSIRKILGCSGVQIVYLLSIEFTKIAVVSILIGLPIAFILARNWLSEFVFKIELQWWYFLIAGVSALVIAWLTIAFQMIKTSMVNPVHYLKEN